MKINITSKVAIIGAILSIILWLVSIIFFIIYCFGNLYLKGMVISNLFMWATYFAYLFFSKKVK